MSSAVKIFRRTIAKPNALTRTNSYAHARSGPSPCRHARTAANPQGPPGRALVVQTSHQVDGELGRSRANPRAPVWVARENGPVRRAAADASRRLRVRDSGARLEPAGGDIYIAGTHLNEAMQGDRVVVRIERIKDGGRAEGRIIRILERANQLIVGRYDRGEGGMGFVVPFDRRVLMDVVIPAGQEGGASPGEMVTVELTRWPTSSRGAIGRVAEVLGDIDAPGVDTEIIIRKYGIPDVHSAEAVAEAVTTRRVGLGPRHPRPDRFPACPNRHDRWGARARLRRRHHHRKTTEWTLLARRAYCGRLGLRAGGKRSGWEAYERGTSVSFPERAVAFVELPSARHGRGPRRPARRPRPRGRAREASS